MRKVSTLMAVAMLLAAISSQAAVRKEQNTKVKFEGMLGRMAGMFGGKAANEGVTEIVALKGDRKLTRTGDTGQLVDLAEEKVYEINFKDKSYKVMTFEEMRQKIREAQEKMQKEMAKMKEQPAPSAPNANNLEVELSVKETGQKKTIAGFDTHEVVMNITMHEKGKKIEDTGGMALVSNIWLTPKLPGSDEILAFDLKFFQKLAVAFDMQQMQQMAMAMAANPMMGDMMKKFAEEAKKLNGTAVLTETRFETVAGKEQMAAAEKQDKDADSNVDIPMGGSKKSIGIGMLGGMMGRAMKKKAEEKQAESAASSTPGHSTIMTSTDQLVSLSSNVADADVALPAGFKEKK
jgi:hypothetical protein